jgi:hypothetical protein
VIELAHLGFQTRARRSAVIHIHSIYVHVSFVWRLNLTAKSRFGAVQRVGLLLIYLIGTQPGNAARPR